MGARGDPASLGVSLFLTKVGGETRQDGHPAFLATECIGPRSKTPPASLSSCSHRGRFSSLLLRFTDMPATVRRAHILGEQSRTRRTRTARRRRRRKRRRPNGRRPGTLSRAARSLIARRIARSLTYRARTACPLIPPLSRQIHEAHIRISRYVYQLCLAIGQHRMDGIHV